MFPQLCMPYATHTGMNIAYVFLEIHHPKGWSERCPKGVSLVCTAETSLQKPRVSAKINFSQLWRSLQLSDKYVIKHLIMGPWYHFGPGGARLGTCRNLLGFCTKLGFCRGFCKGGFCGGGFLHRFPHSFCNRKGVSAGFLQGFCSTFERIFGFLQWSWEVSAGFLQRLCITYHDGIAPGIIFYN